MILSNPPKEQGLPVLPHTAGCIPGSFSLSVVVYFLNQSLSVAQMDLELISSFKCLGYRYAPSHLVRSDTFGLYGLKGSQWQCPGL